MNSNKRAKAAVCAFAIAAAIGLGAGGAFTAGGVTNSAPANVAGFVGGHVDQSITGANITAITYTLDATASNIVGVSITTDAPRGKAMTVAFSGGTTDATWVCVEDGTTDGLFACSVGTGTQTVDTHSLNIQVR
ncbi:MAG: hypothetical protein JWN62_3305 [Acidimicrobiales bacterium]|jgi:hypothetical protein|nr:hypothetical protein [Acidimicrobiales bacterium]